MKNDDSAAFGMFVFVVSFITSILVALKMTGVLPLSWLVATVLLWGPVATVVLLMAVVHVVWAMVYLVRGER